MQLSENSLILLFTTTRKINLKTNNSDNNSEVVREEK